MIPKSLQGILWSYPVKNLSPKKDKVYIINQILSYGRMRDFRWLFKNYPLRTITKVFLNRPIKDYRRERFYFVKNFILPLSAKKLDERYYVKDTPRVIASSKA